MQPLAYTILIDHDWSPDMISYIRDLMQPIDSYICVLDEIMSHISIKHGWILLAGPQRRRSRHSLAPGGEASASTTFLSWMATAPEEPPGLQGPSGCKYYFITPLFTVLCFWVHQDANLNVLFHLWIIQIKVSLLAFATLSSCLRTNLKHLLIHVVMVTVIINPVKALYGLYMGLHHILRLG